MISAATRRRGFKIGHLNIDTVVRPMGMADLHASKGKQSSLISAASSGHVLQPAACYLVNYCVRMTYNTDYAAFLIRYDLYLYPDISIHVAE
jgi:hypothetical protein